MSENDRSPKPAAPMPSDVESLLRQRDELDRVIREQFQRRVAVIFTDIQGSTQYFERYGDLAGRAMVQRHNDLLFPLVAEGGGRVVKTIGDAIMAFFENSASAVQAAIRMQRALAEKNEVWPERERIHIRIGIHVGEALVDSADVYGDTVNTAARIEAQATGGEILISDAVKAELGAGAPGLRARGAVKLRGKAAEVPLFEVRWREREPVSVAVAVGSGKGRWIALGGAAVVLLAGAGFGVRALLGHPHSTPSSLVAANPVTKPPPAPTQVTSPASAATTAVKPAAATSPAGVATEPPAPATPGSATAAAPASRPPTPMASASPPAEAHPVKRAGSKGARKKTPVRTAALERPTPVAAPPQRPAHSVESSRHEAALTGSVRIHVFPFADVFVDGKRVGTGTRDVTVTLPVGAHRLRLVNPAFPEKKLTLHIGAGANEEQDFSLTP